MEPGERNRFVTIQQLTESLGASQLPVRSWSTLATVWASKEDVRGNEQLVAERLVSRYETRWEIGYRVDMNPEVVDVPKTRRLLLGGRIHDIVDASLIGDSDGVELLTVGTTG
jgi:head-tail adaptor